MKNKTDKQGWEERFDKLAKDIPYQKQLLCSVNMNTGDWEIDRGAKRIKSFIRKEIVRARIDQTEQIGYINCLDCDNSGRTMPNGDQCEWCYQFPLSKFNFDQRIAQLEGGEK